MAAGMMEPPEMQNVPNGCEACDSTGYRGRVGVYELLRFNDAMRQAARSGNRNDEMRTLARHNGIKFIQEYALDLLHDGVTTLEEVQRVVTLSQSSTATCSTCGRDLAASFVDLVVPRRSFGPLHERAAKLEDLRVHGDKPPANPSIPADRKSVV